MPIIDVYTQCAPQVATATLVAIVRVESKGNSLAIHDNTTGHSYQPSSKQAAQTLMRQLIYAGHSVDAGLMQVNSRNFLAYNLTAETAFDACENIRVGGAILTAAWSQATSARLTGQTALYHAIQAYNSGNLRGAPEYANKVWHAAGASGVTPRYTAIASRVNTDWQPAAAWAPQTKTEWGLK